MNKLLVIAVMVTLLALSAESYRTPRQAVEEVEEEDLGTLAKVTDTIKSYYEDSINTASGYIDSIRGMKLDEKAMNLYDETTTVVGTYFSIFNDQIYHIIYPH